MANIVKYNSVTISSIMATIEQHKHNPSGIQRSIYDLLTEITSGSVDIVDPTNPFVFLLEASAISTAVAINENISNLRKLYPNLAQTESDLYHHMSDVDYLNRFAIPSAATFVFTLQLNELRNGLHYDFTLLAHKGTIPRNTTVTIDGMVFSLQYPIDVILYDTGILVIKYDTTTTSPLDTLTTNIIEYNVKKDANGLDWVYFKVPLTQFNIVTSYYPIQNSVSFNQTIMFNDSYYYTRVWHKDVNGNWIEFKTTHSDQVYNPTIPTAILKVVDNTVNVTIPTVYVNNNLVSGSIRIDVYESKGSLSVNLANYSLDLFNIVFKAIDENVDLNIFTAVIGKLSIFAYSASLINGGSNSLTFKELKDRVIVNSLGSNNLPITNSQLTARVKDHGFDIIKNIDNITNRVFLATRSLPKPLTKKLITSASMVMIPLLTDIGRLADISRVKTNLNSQTIISNTFFTLVNGQLSILSDSEYITLTNKPKSDLVIEGNANTYLYNPFYYVLDYQSDQFEVRVYDLDYPSIKNISFLSQNETLQLIINTDTYSIIKKDYGYDITIVTKSDNHYKQLNDSEVSVQLAYRLTGTDNRIYFNGILDGRDPINNERIYTFRLITNYFINSSNELTLINSSVGLDVRVPIPLNIEVEIFYNTSSLTNEYLASPQDLLIDKSTLPNNSGNVTYETLQVNLGYPLTRLWKRARVIPSGLEYKRYATDIPRTYDKIEYQKNPTTGAIFTINNGKLNYNILHRPGELVSDISGSTIFKHRKGEVILDSNGLPSINTALSNSKELDLLLIDGKYLIADEINHVNYRKELADTIRSWITVDLTNIQDRLLEQTKIYFHPKNKIGTISVYPDNLPKEDISSEQVFNLNLYVSDTVYNDGSITETLYANSVNIINDYISTHTNIIMGEIIELLKSSYGNIVASFTLTGLGKFNNYSMIRPVSDKDTISLSKKLTQQQDGSIIVVENVTVKFHDITISNATNAKQTYSQSSIAKILAINPIPNTVFNGKRYVFDVTTSNISDGTNLYWVINNITTNNKDFAAISGIISINNNNGRFVIQLTTPLNRKEVSELFSITIHKTSLNGAMIFETPNITVASISDLTYNELMNTCCIFDPIVNIDATSLFLVKDC